MKKDKRRKLDVVVISDVHLGTYGCRAKELLNYLKTINPKTLILNGDIVDIWQFNKRYFPKSHLKVVKYLTSLIVNGCQVYYVTGNHDEMLRKFVGFRLGSFEIVNKLLLNLDGKKAWVFHGDVFDVSMQHAKWLAKLGGIGYDFLILLNSLVNWISEKLGRGRVSLSKRVKNSVKSAVSHINNFEQVAAEIGIDNQYDFVICGHIHQPQVRKIKTKQGKITYLNSGDWVENLSALEYKSGKWKLYHYLDDPAAQNVKQLDLQIEGDLYKADYKNKELFNELVNELYSKA